MGGDTGSEGLNSEGEERIAETVHPFIYLHTFISTYKMTC